MRVLRHTTSFKQLELAFTVTQVTGAVTDGEQLISRQIEHFVQPIVRLDRSELLQVVLIDDWEPVC